MLQASSQQPCDESDDVSFENEVRRGNDHTETRVRLGFADGWHAVPGGTAVPPRRLETEAPYRRWLKEVDPALSSASGSVTIRGSGAKFRRRYFRELDSRSAWQRIASAARRGRVTLSTARTTLNTTTQSRCRSTCEGRDASRRDRDDGRARPAGDWCGEDSMSRPPNALGS